MMRVKKSRSVLLQENMIYNRKDNDVPHQFVLLPGNIGLNKHKDIDVHHRRRASMCDAAVIFG
jgi:hypothetical protein